MLLMLRGRNKRAHLERRQVQFRGDGRKCPTKKLSNLPGRKDVSGMGSGT